MNELAAAESRSTATMDIPNPDFRVKFMSGDEAVYEVGYYLEAKNFGVN